MDIPLYGPWGKYCSSAEILEDIEFGSVDIRTSLPRSHYNWVEYFNRHPFKTCPLLYDEAPIVVAASFVEELSKAKDCQCGGDKVMPVVDSDLKGCDQVVTLEATVDQLIYHIEHVQNQRRLTSFGQIVGNTKPLDS